METSVVTRLIRMALAVPLLAVLCVVFLFDLLLEAVADRRGANPARR
jgi:hypothetical protein